MKPTDRTAEFTEWVRRQPADGEYDSADVSLCALGLFGIPLCLSASCERKGIPIDVYWTATGGLPATFGALLTRLEALT